MEGIVYLLVRMACIFYLLYKVWCWKSRVDEICRLLYGKGAETGAEALVEYPKDTGTEDVMGSTRFVYTDEGCRYGSGSLYEPAAGNVSGLYRRGGRNTGRGSGMQFVFGGNGTVEKRAGGTGRAGS